MVKRNLVVSKAAASELTNDLGAAAVTRSWFWPVFLSLGLSASVIWAFIHYRRGGFERHGAIRLGEPGTQNNFSNLFGIVRSTVSQASEWIFDRLFVFKDFLSSRTNRRSGYTFVQPIPRPSMDRGFENDTSLMEFEDY